MTSPIDPIRRAAHLRRGRRATDVDRSDAAREAQGSNLPVPVDDVRAPPPPEPPPPAAAVFAAQMLGQDGQKRGLNGGPSVIDTANTSYNRTEWSGAKDRRAQPPDPSGSVTLICCHRASSSSSDET